MLECEKANKFTRSKENSKGEWGEIEIYRKNKKKTLREKCAHTEFFLVFIFPHSYQKKLRRMIIITIKTYMCGKIKSRVREI